MRNAFRWLSAASIPVIAMTGCSGGSSSGGSTNSEPAPPLTWYVSFEDNAVADGEVRTALDVLSYRPSTDAKSLFASVPASSSEIDAFERVNDSNFYFSLRNHAIVDAFAIAPGDVVQFLSGTYAIVFDASAAGLPDGVNVDAFALADNGDFVLSTNVHFASGGNTFSDSDLIRYDGSDFSLFLSASDIGVDDSAELTGVTLQGDSQLWLTFDGIGSANGLTFDANDVLSADSSNGINEIAFDSQTTVADGTPITALSINR